MFNRSVGPAFVANAMTAVLKASPTKDVRCGCCGETFQTFAGTYHVATCPKCGGLDIVMPLGDDVQEHVKVDSPMLANAGPRGARYFHFTTEDGGGRYGHGWYDVATLRVVQWG